MIRREVLIALARCGQLTDERAVIVRKHALEVVQSFLVEWGACPEVLRAAGLKVAAVPEYDGISEEQVGKLVSLHLAARGLRADDIVFMEQPRAERLEYDPEWASPLGGLSSTLLAQLGLSSSVIPIAVIEGSEWRPLRELIEHGVWPFGLTKSGVFAVVKHIIPEELRA